MEEFSGGRGEEFRLLAGREGSQVIPEKPFSIVDKRPFLETAGFRRFILDLSGPPLKKKDYRALMTAYQSASPIPGISRFNWKDGFFHDDAEGAAGRAITKPFQKQVSLFSHLPPKA
jgi:putative protease